jgi:uncharacterized protein
MTDQHFTDAAPIVGTRMTADGYLVATVRCARTGCQDYLAAEVGLADDGIVRVYRPEAAVFDKASMATFAHKPVTVGHPNEPVTADNWRRYAVGDVGEEVARDGDFIRVSLTLMDADAIKAVRDGLREISMGYTTPIEMKDGTAPDGTAYQAVQTGPIRINHLALVDRARGGEQLRIGDDAQARWGASPITIDRKDVNMADAVKTRTVLIDGLSVETTDAGAQALEKLNKTIADKDTALAQKDAAHDKAIAAKDAEIETLKGKLDAANEKILDDAALDKRVADRTELIGKASAIAKDVKTAGLSDAAIRKAVVQAKLGDKAVTEKSDAYIEARFDVLAEDAAKGDPFAKAMNGGPKLVGDANEADQAYAKHVADVSTAYRGAAQKEA